MVIFAECTVIIFFVTLIGDEENIDRFNRRLVKVTKEHNEECKQLLKLMGVPYVEVIIRFKNLRIL